jgi:site-specific DNA-methyltransferase (adenine-specific)
MREMDAESVDAVVCDPPYGLAFMGKEWDHGVPGVPFWVEALRVMKPGAHALVFGGDRTHHRLMVAIEDAGFEIRTCLYWLFGAGFPKSLNVSKAIDKAAGAERKVVGPRVRLGDAKPYPYNSADYPGSIIGERGQRIETRPATDAARKWDGWGTALKPAAEIIILARRPLGSTVAACVLKHGTGGLNIDGCRIGFADNADRATRDAKNPGRDDRFGGDVYGGSRPQQTPSVAAGRWPANVLLDEEAARMLDEQSGERKTGAVSPYHERHDHASSYRMNREKTFHKEADSGGASRFFYTAKASNWDRNDGLEGMPERANRINAPRENEAEKFRTIKGNHHPTVKPTDLMRWLCRLVTPPGGLILDPFCGSGSTGVAAEADGFRFIGIEQDAEYVEIAKRRIGNVAPLFEEKDAGA